MTFKSVQSLFEYCLIVTKVMATEANEGTRGKPAEQLEVHMDKEDETRRIR